ncbi:uncharacterized protein BT62DRAFT_1002371 [Guyanagaster necrorhizus]|uniref:F-box domain-containing protein n=1 Tax=Guyanagaster necrorhizus TaxID=856835 RepID=A0A9P8AWC3_9AGAR|nr:uncharacterized protein BT62DRAFT_1002371 [Guyanagaster necrorhizus MCA 3950]KAG7450036.1 hypothetical protein BT62DRAFT_1002371 [Guyanagaster necrorhizus MCA 3950]
MSTRSAPNKRRETRAATTVLARRYLLEIFGHLLPYDILRLARSTRNFRRLIMHPSSLSCWGASLANVLDLPDPFPGMTEPAWVNLVFNPQCHVYLPRLLHDSNAQFTMLAQTCHNHLALNHGCGCTLTQMEGYAGERHAGRYASVADRQKATRRKHILRQDFS